MNWIPTKGLVEDIALWDNVVQERKYEYQYKHNIDRIIGNYTPHAMSEPLWVRRTSGSDQSQGHSRRTRNDGDDE